MFHQLYGKPNYHMNVRSTGVQYITNNPERFIKSSTDYSWSRYLANMSHQGTWANTHVIQEWSKLFIHNLKHIHTNFMSEICYSIWFNGKKWSLRNGVGQTIAKMWILTVHPTSPQQFKVILSSFNSIRGLPTGCLCLLVKVNVFVKRNLPIFKTHSNVMYPRFIHSFLWFHIWSFLVNT